MFCIRKVKPEDNYKNLIERGKLKEGKSDLVMVAFDEDRLVGACSMEINNEEAEINSVFVKEESRSEGIGFALIKSILNVAERRGIKTVAVLDKKEIRSFFVKLKFFPSEDRPGMLVAGMEGYFGDCSCCK